VADVAYYYIYAWELTDPVVHAWHLVRAGTLPFRVASQDLYFGVESPVGGGLRP
jgi:hypothetical protein